MKKYLNIAGLLLVILLSLLPYGCNYNNIEIGDIKDIKLEKIQSDNITLNISLPVNNPNNYRINITKYDLNIKINKQSFKLVEKQQNIVIPKKYTGIIQLPIELKSEGLLSFKTIQTLYSVFSGKKADIEASGTLRFRVFLLSKKINVEEKRQIYF